MAFKAGLLFLTLLIASNAFPVENEEEQDMSIFFDHTDPESRIVGGVIAGIVPYMASLTTGVFSRTLICGASLISTTRLLTAAHCINGVVSGGALHASLRANLGNDRWHRGGTQYTLSRHVNHPDYSHSTIKNDIGILITTNTVTLTDIISTVALSFDFAGAGVLTTVTGFGRTMAGGPISEFLLRLDAVVVDGQRCVVEVAQRAAELAIRAPHVDPEVEICTFHSNRRGTCNGDSGSPLIRIDRQQQIGIVSWGLPCARNVPDMFVRVSAFKDWIQQHM